MGAPNCTGFRGVSVAGASVPVRDTFSVEVCDSGLTNVVLASSENDGAAVDCKEGVKDSENDVSDD